MSFELLETIAYLLTGGFLVFLAITITRDNFTNRVNRVTGGLLLFAGLAPISIAVGYLLTQGVSETTPFEQTTLYSFHLTWELFFPTLVVFALLFPFNRLKGLGNTRWIYLLLAPQLIHLFLELTFGELNILVTNLENRVTEGGLSGIFLTPLSYIATRLIVLLGIVKTYSVNIFGVINLTYVMISVYLLETGRKLQTNPRLQAQTNVVLWGLRLALGIFVISQLTLHFDYIKLPEKWLTALRLTALLIGGGAFAFGIIRRQFLDIRLVFRQSLIYTFTSILLVGTYIFLAMQSAKFLVPFFGARAETISYLFIVFILLLFPSISNWIDTIIRSMFMRTRTDYRNIIERFSREAISMFEPAKLRQTIDEALKTSLLVDNVYFVLYDDSVGEYAILQSDDYSKRTVISRDDMLLRGINLLDKPTSYSSLNDYQEDSQLAAILNERSIKLILPLKDANHLIGFLALTGKAAGYRYTPEDYNLLAVLSNQMVIALTNARLYADSLEKIRLQEEISMARQIQLDLLPDKPPDIPNTMICAESTPSRTVGGDFYDFIPVNRKERMGIVIADASGKGMPAALLIAQIQAILHSEVNNGNPISVVMKNMNQQIYRATSSEKYVTLFYGEYDHVSRDFHYSNAGHNYPMLVRECGEVEFLIEGGPIIGALPGIEYQSATVRLNDNDVLFLFTDGLSEAMDKDDVEYGEPRIRDFIVERRGMDPEVIMSELVRDVRQFDPTHPPQDDTTMVAIKIRNGKIDSHESRL